jgi:hypothetical protein
VFRRGWVCAPFYDLTDKTFREVALIFQSELRPFVVRLSEHERTVIVRNMGGGLTEIRGKSADNPTSLLGEGLDWLIIDEASRVKADTWERFLSARLLDKKGWALLISSPKGKNWFYDAWRMGKKLSHGFESWNSPTWTNPIIDRAEIEALRERLPEAIFRQEYGAEFIEGAGQVFRNMRDLATVDAWADPVKDARYVAGLDLARVNDYTVLVIMDARARRVVHVERFTRVDWKIQVARIGATTARYGNCYTLVDSTGAGEPVYEALLEAGIRADGYPFTSASKAALVNNLALMCERGEIALPRYELWPDGIEELEAFEFSVTEGGTVKTGAPAGQHDDCVCALMLACWAAKDVGRGFEVVEF